MKLFNQYKIIIFILFIGFFIGLVSCNVTKNVPAGKLMLKENKINVNEKDKSDTNLNPYILQKPNVKLFKWFPLQLWLYNMGNPDFEKKWQNDISKYQDSTYFWTQLLSEKQMIGFANFKKNIRLWYFKQGEAPVLLDEKKTQKSLETLRLYYIDQGYFKAKTQYKIDTLINKKAEVVYKVTTGSPFYIDSIFHQIPSKVLDRLYNQNIDKTLIKAGQIFKTENFENEAIRLTEIFRNSGVFHFSKYAINFRDIDSTRADFKTDVLVDIGNQIIESEDTVFEKPYEISYIKDVNIFTDYTFSAKPEGIKDSLDFDNLKIMAYGEINYKPRFLTRSIFIKPGETYSDFNLELTRKHLRSLQSFKTIKINFEENEPNQLTANILLTPVKRFGFKIETEATHSNQKPLGISGKMSFSNHNTFRGNEILQFSLQGSFLNSSNINSPKFFNAWEVGADIAFKIPRISLPFKIEKIIPQRMFPKTNFTIGSSFQKNIGLDKERFTGIIEYAWQPINKINHSLEVFNMQFIKNLNILSFFNIYSSEFKKIEKIKDDFYPFYVLDASTALGFIKYVLGDNGFHENEPDSYQIVENVLYRYNIITEDILVPSISYSYTYNSQNNFKDNDFHFYKIRLSSAGLLSNLVSKKTENGTKQFLGTNIAQYLKLDLEYKKYWQVSSTKTLAFRYNMGIAIPYGNSKVIPFSRSYFAGGTNDIRAWKIYELGPGSEKTGLEFNVGNLKLLSSLEYRFDIFGSLKGALFADAGNIWDISDTKLTTVGSQFIGLSSLKNTALGTGIGFRYDFSFLVFRADVGLKTYEPYETTGNKWFRHYNLKNAELNLGINYPF
jgi:outer membrane protein assembly factor BamA